MGSNAGHFKEGEKHPKWKGGKRIIKSGRNKGYVEITAGKWRNKKEHWVVMWELLQEPVSYMLNVGMLESGEYEVHHVDFNRRHNCPGNLLFLQACIHRSFSGFADRKNVKVARVSKEEEEGYLREIAGL